MDPLAPKMLLIFFFSSKQGGEGGTYVHGTYDNASSPSSVGHLWIIVYGAMSICGSRGIPKVETDRLFETTLERR